MKAEAARHLQKAQEFLEASKLACSAQLNSPAVSAAIHAVIHAKDAYCLELTGSTTKSKSHHAAVGELQKAGGVPTAQIEQFRALLAAKNNSEYEALVFTNSKTIQLLTQAERFCDFVKTALNSGAN